MDGMYVDGSPWWCLSTPPPLACPVPTCCVTPPPLSHVLPGRLYPGTMSTASRCRMHKACVCMVSTVWSAARGVEFFVVQLPLGAAPSTRPVSRSPSPLLAVCVHRIHMCIVPSRARGSSDGSSTGGRIAVFPLPVEKHARVGRVHWRGESHCQHRVRREVSVLCVVAASGGGAASVGDSVGATATRHLGTNFLLRETPCPRWLLQHRHCSTSR